MSNKALFALIALAAAVVAAAWWWSKERLKTQKVVNTPAPPMPGLGNGVSQTDVPHGTVVPAAYVTTHTGAFTPNGNGTFTVSDGSAGFRGAGKTTTPTPPSATAPAVPPPANSPVLHAVKPAATTTPRPAPVATTPVASAPQGQDFSGANIA